jgi:hypothetical protein
MAVSYSTSMFASSNAQKPKKNSSDSKCVCNTPERVQRSKDPKFFFSLTSVGIMQPFFGGLHAAMLRHSQNLNELDCSVVDATLYCKPILL